VVTSLFLAVWLQTPGLAPPPVELRRGTPQASVAEPVVSIWYRGTGGVPKLDDLALIRAQGFTAITWPASQSAHAADLHRLAGTLGLGVSIQTAPVHLSPDAASRPGDRVDVVVSRTTAAEIPALVWRAVAHGARTIAFDPGTSPGSGLTDANGRPLPWVAPAAAIARQLTFNARLFAEVRPGPAPTIQAPAPAGVEVVLLETPRVWVLVSTNTSASRITAVAELPKSVAPALWTSLLDGSGMSMLSRPDGPRWTLQLAPGEAGVWTIEK
jgi:hypothetical protein